MSYKAVKGKTNPGPGARDSFYLVAALLGAKAAVLFGAILILANGDLARIGYLLSAPGLSALVHSIGTSWDSVDYQSIARMGYGPVGNSELFAFSPVYPILIRLVEYFTGSYVISSLLISNILSFVFPLIILRLFGFRTALLAETFPVYVVFTMTAYSDVLALLFLALGLLAFVRARYLMAGISAAAAGLVFYDLLLIPFFLACWLAYERAKQNTPMVVAARPLATLLLPGLAAGLSILLFYYDATGDPFKFFALERADWGVALTNPVGQLLWLLQGSGPGSFSSIAWNVVGFLTTPAYWAVRNLLVETFVFLGVFLLARNRGSRLSWFCAAYALVITVPLLFVEGTPVYSIPRLLLPAFPVFFGYSSLFRARLSVVVYLVVSVTIACWILVSFVEGFFA